MNLTNDTYIQRTLKGDKALLQKPPIPFKLRALLHEIPQLGRKSFFLRKDLIKVSDLYVKSNSDDPIGFFKQINDIFEKGWIDVVNDDEIEPLITENEKKIDEDDNLFKNSDHSDEYKEENYDFVAVYNKENIVKNDNEVDDNQVLDYVPLNDVSLDSKETNDNIEINDKSLNDMNSDIEKWVENNAEEEEVEIPWSNPFMTLDDYLKSENPDIAYDKKNSEKTPIKKEFVKNKDEFSDDFVKNDPWDMQDYHDSSSGSKTKEEKFKEQMDLMKAEQRRKNRNVVSKNSNSENNKKTKKKNEDESTGISSFINKLFGKK